MDCIGEQATTQMTASSDRLEQKTKHNELRKESNGHDVFLRSMNNLDLKQSGENILIAYTVNTSNLLKETICYAYHKCYARDYQNTNYFWIVLMLVRQGIETNPGPG